MITDIVDRSVTIVVEELFTHTHTNGAFEDENIDVHLFHYDQITFTCFVVIRYQTFDSMSR